MLKALVNAPCEYLPDIILDCLFMHNDLGIATLTQAPSYMANLHYIWSLSFSFNFFLYHFNEYYSFIYFCIIAPPFLTSFPFFVSALFSFLHMKNPQEQIIPSRDTKNF